MNLKANRLRALRGFLYSDFIDSRKLYIIAASIIFGYIAISTALSMGSLGASGESNNNGGALFNRFGTAAICMFISAIVMCGKKKRESVFAFPMDRITYSVGNLIMFYINTAILLLITSFGYFVEIIIYKALSSFIENFIYVNIVTREAFLTGFVVTLLNIVLITTITHFVSMTIARFKLPALIVFAMVIGLPFIFPFGRTAFFKVFMFFASESYPLILCIKLFVLSLLFQALSFLPLRKMEVNS